MTNSPPPDPESSQRNSLGFDEFIGIFIAFSAIGAILFWSLSKRGEGFNLGGVPLPSPSASAQPITPSLTTPETAPVTPLAPTQSPEVLTQIPSRTTTPVTPISPTPTPAQALNFVDVPQNYWARPFIDALSARRIVNGFPGGYFRPEQPVTRAEFAALLQEAFAQNSEQRTVTYKDISSGFWAIPSIASATKTGFLQGYPGNIFRPTQQIPKVQVLVALASGLNLPVPSSAANALRNYDDVNQIPNYATEKIAAATAAGLVVNHPNLKLLNPNQNATRAEVAAMIYQALVQSGKAEPIQSQYITQP